VITIHEIVGNAIEKHSIDKYSVMLLMALTLPIAVMALLLLAWPDIYWRSIVPFGVVDVLGCFAMILLAVFLVARYTRQSGIIYFSAALVTMSVTEAFFLLTTPDAPHYIWLKFFSGIAGGLLTLRYIMARRNRPESGIEQVNGGQIMLILGGVAAAAAVLSWIILKFSTYWPALSMNSVFTPAGWTMYGIVVSILCFAGARLFIYFRKTGSKEILPVAVVLIFLFQGNEATQIAPPWSIVWWFWQGMRIVVFVAALVYVLSGYIRLSNALILEVQERKRVVDELAVANANWYSSFNSLEDAMFIVDHKYRLMNMNDSATRLLGKMRREILGRHIDRVIHTGTLSPNGAVFRQVLDTHGPVSVEEYNERLGRHFCIKCSPVTDQQQRVVRFVILLHDVTHRVESETKERKLQQELSQASRLAAIGELAATVAHEMNNPLTSVIGFSELLKSADVPYSVKENLDIINHSAQRAAGVVQKLLSFARQRKDDRNPADINTLVSMAVKMRSNELRMNNIEVKTSLADDLPMLVVDSAQMEQVLLNLIINAEQSMIMKRNGGKLFIRTSRKDDCVRIQITDNGIGIAGENIEKIFKTFFTTRAGEGGTGLGLGVCRSIVNDHKGRIFASSRCGRGACFTIELPIGVASALELEVAPPAKCLPQLGARVLVVDDELSVRLMINRALSREGYSVDTAENGRIALEEYRKNRYDLLLVDIRMPDLDGIELYYRLREADPAIAKKIIFITGDLMGARNRMFVQENKLPALAKPFGIHELRQQVEAVLSGIACEKQSPDAIESSFNT
jgi:PAS domain S-box-containing protein